ncbi:MAG: amino acid hydroxylase [Herpetosiphonaceae bacterium]|nr:amino acid hydroxylase [Herpetosiphonaceae bacterium]
MDTKVPQPFDDYEARLRRDWTDREHETWAKLYERQMECITGLSCQAFNEGLHMLGYDPKHLPDPVAISQLIRQHSGWGLTSAQNEYLGATEWFEHIVGRRFPVTEYIRDLKDLDFTPLPDLFHEYFGHLALFTDQRFADISQQFGELYLLGDERQRADIAKLWWFSIEFAFIKEDGEEKVLGAGLLSSPGELEFARHGGKPHHPFTIERVTQAKPAAYSFHEEYFVLDSIEQMQQVIDEYAQREGLPMHQRAVSLV